MNRSTELRYYLEKIPKLISSEEYLRRIFNLPSYIFVIVCNALMDRKISINIMDPFIAEVENEFIKEKKWIDYGKLLNIIRFDFEPTEVFPDLRTDKELFLASIIKKFIDDKPVDTEFYIKEIKNSFDELERENKIKVERPNMKIDKIIRNKNLDSIVNVKGIQYLKNQIRLKSLDIYNFESIKRNLEQDIQEISSGISEEEIFNNEKIKNKKEALKAVNTKLSKFKLEFGVLTDELKAIEDGNG